MKESAYIRLKKSLSILIGIRQKQLKNAEDKYLKSNNKYTIGQRVKLFLRGNYMGEGEITGNEFSNEGKIDTQPIITRFNPDGSKAKTRWWVKWNYDKIEED